MRKTKQHSLRYFLPIFSMVVVLLQTNLSFSHYTENPRITEQTLTSSCSHYIKKIDIYLEFTEEGLKNKEIKGLKDSLQKLKELSLSYYNNLLNFSKIKMTLYAWRIQSLNKNIQKLEREIGANILKRLSGNSSSKKDDGIRNWKETHQMYNKHINRLF